MKIPTLAPVVPTLPVSTDVSGGNAQAARTAAAHSHPPPSIEGTVLAQPSNGMLLVRTANGTVIVPSATPIAIGETVRVPLEALASRHQPSSGAPTASPRGALAPVTSTPAALTSSGNASPVAAALSSNALSRPTAAAPGMAATLMAPLRWSVAAHTPAPTAGPAANAETAATPPVITLPAGSRLIVDIVASPSAQPGGGQIGASTAGPPMSTLPGTPVAAPGQTLPIIDAQAVDAQTSLVRTPLGVLRLPVPLDRITPAGSSLRVLDLPSPPSTPSASTALDAHGWPALERALAILGDPSASAPAATALPRADQGLAGAVVRFLERDAERRSRLGIPKRAPM